MTHMNMKSNCDPKCNLLSYDDLPDCQLPEESKCMLEDFLDRFKEVEPCFKPKRALTFDVEHSKFHNHLKVDRTYCFSFSF